MNHTTAPPITLAISDHTACPAATHPDHDSAHIVASHHDQGWVLLCNGVVVFDDTGELYPDRHSDAPHRPDAPHRSVDPFVSGEYTRRKAQGIREILVEDAIVTAEFARGAGWGVLA